MNTLNSYRIVQICGAALFAVMAILMAVGTTSTTTFVVWIALAAVGLVIFKVARSMDEQARDRARAARRAAEH